MWKLILLLLMVSLNCFGSTRPFDDYVNSLNQASSLSAFDRYLVSQSGTIKFVTLDAMLSAVAVPITKIQGHLVTAPTLNDNGKALTYNSTSTAFEFTALPDTTSYRVDSKIFANLSTALTSSTTFGKTVIVSTASSINNKTTNRDIEVVKGGSINVASGKTLTTSGLFKSNFNPFAGSGSVVVGAVPANIAGFNYSNGPIVIGVTMDLPLANSSAVYNSYDNPPVNNTFNFNVVSQMWSGETPSPSPDWSTQPVAHNGMLGGGFFVHRGGNSASFAQSLNTQVNIADGAVLTGTANINNQTVTWVSGSQFVTGTAWQNASITLHSTDSLYHTFNKVYRIVSVESPTSMTVKLNGYTTNPTDVASGLVFNIGGANGLEIDINNAKDDVNEDLLGTTGLIVTSGGRARGYHAKTALLLNGAWGPTSDWVNGIVIPSYTGTGIYVGTGNASFPNAKAIDIYNSTTSSSYITGGNPALVIKAEASQGALTLKNGSTVTPTNPIFTTLAADGITALSWINQQGEINSQAEITKKITLSGVSSGNMINIVPTSDIPGNPVINSFMANGTTSNWYITQSGTHNLRRAVTTVTYSADITPNCGAGFVFNIVPTNGTAFTINPPSNTTYVFNGQEITFRIINTYGTPGTDTLGVATWSSAIGGYRKSTWVQPLSGSSRAITFIYDSGSSLWREISRTPADVPN